MREKEKNSIPEKSVKNEQCKTNIKKCIKYKNQESEFIYHIAESRKICNNCKNEKIIIYRREKLNRDNQSSKSMCYNCHTDSNPIQCLNNGKYTHTNNPTPTKLTANRHSKQTKRN